MRSFARFDSSHLWSLIMKQARLPRLANFFVDDAMFLNLHKLQCCHSKALRAKESL
jgi:hypothetical protein